MLKITATLPSADEDAADDAWFVAWRGRELARLDASGTCYLDYTGTSLAPASLLACDLARLQAAVLGNPHSHHRPSEASSDALAAARSAILAFVGGNSAEHEVVLTANATAALRLVGEGFRFGPNAALLLAEDNHNSVVGLREYAARAGAAVATLPLDATLRGADWHGRVAGSTLGPGLLAFPAQSNFSGVRHPLALVAEARARGWAVLLDAAAFLPTATLDLATVPADFVALSLYKIAGWPGGLGALVARRDALARLRRPWFSGGTVEWVTHAPPRHHLRSGAEGFEDGTPAFLAAGAVAAALDAVRAVGPGRLARHLGRLTARCLDGLGALEHPGGRPALVRYGPGTTAHRGATIAINLLDADGTVVPHEAVERAAADRGLAVRGGCFCNPGAAAAAFGWDRKLVSAGLDELGEHFSPERLAARIPGRAVGAIRLSFGLGSVAADVARALEVLEAIRGERQRPTSNGRRGVAVRVEPVRS